VTRPAACLALLLACAAPARAGIVSFDFTGSAFSTGSPVAGRFTYDTSAPDLLPPDPHHARYRSTGVFEATYTPPDPLGQTFTIRSRDAFYIDVYDDYSGPAGALHDTFRIEALTPELIEGGRRSLLLPTAIFDLTDSTDAALPGVGLPTSLDLAAFDTREGGLAGLLPYGYTVTSMTTTPEPSTLTLLGLGGVAIAARGLRRRLTH
jgi:hypothetical protein